MNPISGDIPAQMPSAPARDTDNLSPHSGWQAELGGSERFQPQSTGAPFTAAQAPDANATSSAPPVARRNLTPWVIAGVIALLVAGGLAVFLTVAKLSDSDAGSGRMPLDTRSSLQLAAEACGISTAISDSGHTLTMSHVAPEETTGPISVDEYNCAISELNMPQSVLDHIGTTRAIDGMQEDSWDDLRARWTYHPDNGLSITITQN